MKIKQFTQQQRIKSTNNRFTKDRNGNPMSNLLVSRDLTSNKTTDSQGVAEYSLSKTCGCKVIKSHNCGYKILK